MYQSPDFTTEEPCCSKSLEEDNNQDPEYMVVGQQEDYTSSEVCTVSNTSSDILTLATPVSNSERTQIYLEMDALRKERDLLQNTNDELRNTLKQSGLRYAAVIQAPDKCLMLTGLKVEILSKLVSYLSEGFNSSFTKPYKLSFPDQIILTIIKLKHNIVFELLAFVYGVGVSTAIDYFWNWLDIMYVKLKGLVKMQDRDYIFQTIPSVFKSKFPRLTSIIDCFEVFIESPSSLLARAKFYSQYKKHCTIKVLISCTPLGAINFVSQCYGGRTSDIQIVKESGFHFSEYHMPGDQILADRGFNLRDEFAAGSSSELLIPSFTRGKKQLSAKEVETSRKIASVRIHIERVIGLLRNRYTILKGTIPLRTVNSIKAEASSSTLASCDKIVNVCAALTNLCDSIVYK